MRNKASLVLLEQLVMILVFALAAAVCLHAFVWADNTSRQVRLRDEAAVLCQNGAEALKAHRNVALAAGALGAEKTESGWLLCRTDGEEALQLWLRQEAGTQPGLGMARVWVVREETGEILFSITTGWQEVAS